MITGMMNLYIRPHDVPEARQFDMIIHRVMIQVFLSLKVASLTVLSI